MGVFMERQSPVDLKSYLRNKIALNPYLSDLELAKCVKANTLAKKMSVRQIKLILTEPGLINWRKQSAFILEEKIKMEKEAIIQRNLVRIRFPRARK
jgi:hypothetical protein